MPDGARSLRDLADYLEWSARSPGSAWLGAAAQYVVRELRALAETESTALGSAACTAEHRVPQGPNEDIGICQCGRPSFELRPEGEAYGLHDGDCSLPSRHLGYCAPGGSGHPPAVNVRGWFGWEFEQRYQSGREATDQPAGAPPNVRYELMDAVHDGIHAAGGHCSDHGADGDEPLCLAVADSLIEAGWRHETDQPGEGHPDLIDRDGDLWTWIRAYYCVNHPHRVHDREYVELCFGPVYEEAPDAE